MFIRERATLKRSAHQKFAISNPGTIALAAQMSNAFRTNAKSPKVTIVRGNVSMRRSGRRNPFMKPSTTATTSATRKLSTVTPGKRYAAMSIDMEDTNQFKNIFIYSIIS